MDEIQKKDIETDLEPDSKGQDIGTTKTNRNAFSKLAFELTDEDLNSKGTQKLLLSEISRLESETLKLNDFRTKYYNSDKESAVLKEKQKIFMFSEILYSISLTIGAMLIGLTPSINSNNVPSWLISGIGGILIIGSILAKVIKR